MVAVEGACAGAVPLLARHSGLAELAEALERAVPAGAPYGFEPGPGAVHRIAAGIRAAVERPPSNRARLGEELHRFASTRWSWDQTASLLLDAARVR